MTNYRNIVLHIFSFLVISYVYFNILPIFFPLFPIFISYKSCWELILQFSFREQNETVTNLRNNTASNSNNNFWNYMTPYFGEMVNACKMDNLTSQFVGKNIKLLCQCTRVQMCVERCIWKLSSQRVGLCQLSIYCLSAPNIFFLLAL